MKVNLPTVGPILGFTTHDQARLFLRGVDERHGTELRRCFGVVRWKRASSNTWSKPLYNKLSPNFDMTGVFALQGLSKATKYDYQAGWFFAEAELDKIQGLDEKLLEWADPDNKNGWSFTTGTPDPNAARSYIVGSCRYLLRLFGGSWFDDRGDKAFRSVLEQIEEKGMPVHGLLMVGDQIYADDLNFLAPDARMDEFLQRYRTAFSQEHIRKLMSQVPTYMILDDHEIEDNWPSKASTEDRVTLYPHAIHSYQIYQCSHSPLFEADDKGRIDGTLTHFWYNFTDGCADWFVMDSRTERLLTPTRLQMINDVQLKGLLSWLSDGSGRVKFVVTSVPFFPDLRSESSDKWTAFAAQREAILECIRSKKIRKVIFVSGDVHCSFSSLLTLSSDPDFAVNTIVSSSFFWPYPHTSEADFVFDSPLKGTGERQYVSKRTSPVVTTDNFARIDADPTEVRVTFFERKGARLGKPVRIAF